MNLSYLYILVWIYTYVQIVLYGPIYISSKLNYHPLSIYLIVHMYSSIRIVNLCFHGNKILYQLEYKVCVQCLSLVFKIPLIMEIPWSAPFNLHTFIKMFLAFLILLAYPVIFCIPFQDSSNSRLLFTCIY